MLNCTIPPWTSWLCCCTLRLRLLLPFSSSTISPSAYVILGAGHGSTCGRPTTKKLASMVVANKDEVIRDLGWRCGGMMARRGWWGAGNSARQSISLIEQTAGNHQLHLHKATRIVVMACGLKSSNRVAATSFGADRCAHGENREGSSNDCHLIGLFPAGKLLEGHRLGAWRRASLAPD